VEECVVCLEEEKERKEKEKEIKEKKEKEKNEWKEMDELSEKFHKKFLRNFITPNSQFALISRNWVEAWRDWVRNFSENSPNIPPLDHKPFLCQHNLLAWDPADLLLEISTENSSDSEIVENFISPFYLIENSFWEKIFAR
jgi:hypothetical protein